MSREKIFINQNVQQKICLRKSRVITNTPSGTSKEFPYKIIYLAHYDSFSSRSSVYISHFILYPFFLFLPLPRRSLMFVLILLVLLRLLEFDCPDYCDTFKLQHQFSINSLDYNYRKQILNF